MRKSKKVTSLLVLGAIIPTLLTGCYYKTEVQSNEFGLIMSDGVTVSEVVGAGRYTDMKNFYAEIKVIDGQAKQVTWSDDNLWTADKQVIGFEVSTTYARTKESAEMMWDKYRDAAKSDQALEDLVLARIPRVAKSVTSSRILDDLLTREDLQIALKEQLSAELKEIGVELLDIGVNNIVVDQAYADVLSQKATASIKADLAKEETNTKREQLEQEKAQTEIELEKARRDRLVSEEQAKIYDTNESMKEIRLAEIYSDALKNSNTIYLPSDTILNIINGGVDTNTMAGVN